MPALRARRPVDGQTAPGKGTGPAWLGKLDPAWTAVAALALAALLAAGQEAAALVALGLRPLLDWLGRLFQ